HPEEAGRNDQIAERVAMLRVTRSEGNEATVSLVFLSKRKDCNTQSVKQPVKQGKSKMIIACRAP
ncbi:MAG: hypothetical protein V4616_07065, partial [Bacteroidota bacterium]